MQSIRVYNMDHDLLATRRKMQEHIEILLRRSRFSLHWSHKVPEFSRKLEARIFDDTASKDEYINMTTEQVEHKLQAILRKIQSNIQQLDRVSPSSTIRTMIPTPCILQGGSQNSVTPADISTNGTSVATVTAETASTRNLFPTASGSFNASNGKAPNACDQSLVSVSHSAGENNVIPSIGKSRQSNQMFPTPGLNNPQSMTINSEYSNGGGFSSMDSSLVSEQPARKIYIENQNNRVSRGLGGHVPRAKTNMQNRASPNRLPSGGSWIVQNSLQPATGLETPEGFSGVASRTSQQRYDSQHHQTKLLSLQQKMLPPAGNGGATNTTDHSGSRHLNGSLSSIISAANNQNMNPMGLHLKQKTNRALLNRHGNFQSMQEPPHFKFQTLSHSQNTNFQAAQISREHLLQNVEQEQFQQPNQPYDQQNQHFVSKTNATSPPSVAFGFGGLSLLDHDTESYNEVLIPNATAQYQLSELLSQYPQSTFTTKHSKPARLLGQPSFSESSQKTNESRNEFRCLPSKSQPDALQQGQSRQKSQHGEQDEVQQSQFTSEASMLNPVSRQTSSGLACGPRKCTLEEDYRKQVRWLLFLLHAHKCSAPEGSCPEEYCVTVQQLWLHMNLCNTRQCGYPRCCTSKQLFYHYLHCRIEACPLCVPARKVIACARKAQDPSVFNADIQINDLLKTVDRMDGDELTSKRDKPSTETSDVTPSSPKRMKSHHSFSSPASTTESSPVSVPHMNPAHASEQMQHQSYQLENLATTSETEADEVKTESTIASGKENLPVFGNIKDDGLKIVHDSRPHGETIVLNEGDVHADQEELLVEKERDQAVVELKQDVKIVPSNIAAGKPGKLKSKGVSLTELFSPEQMKEHIVSLRQWVGQSKAKAEKNQAMNLPMNENSCQLCAVEKLTLEPPPVYCTLCGARIKRNATYHTTASGVTRYFFCTSCYNEARGDTIYVDGTALPKALLDKKKNDEAIEESWVQCDKCDAWQHQICALFNGRRNDGGQAEYTCPTCYIEEIEKGERIPLQQSAVLGAKDLPGTILSDHLEQWLAKRLKEERLERARQLGKSFDEVPGAEALIVRVVSSIDKKIEVKQHFLDIFEEGNYPTEFQYKSKVILLFQKIEGVEVCLFGMYVQEYGSECQSPNQRMVYLSYLDSVKYFRPEIKQQQIGYLEYCKKRGFTSCYIWASPPLKGEDYILYCHPEIQKTPKSDKLREWYLMMLRKAMKEKIVADITNLYDHFFVSEGECKAKVTAARLPYFDGDYWPGAAEDMINQIRRGEDGRSQQKKEKARRNLTKRALKAAGQSEISANASMDALLMQKLGKTIYPMKEDFIMVHFQHSCTRCCILMLSGVCWVCDRCKNFKLCQRCYDTEQNLDGRDRHPINSKEKHDFFPVKVDDVPSDTEDKDEILESEFFDTRQSFLSLCQGNHYQYNTLRQAKHSSMMVLYHLHNPTVSAFVPTCSACHNDVETGECWRCEICPDFEVCNACYQKDGGVDHPHKLTHNPSTAERDAENEALQTCVLQPRKMLDLLVHASQCRSLSCQFPNCWKFKGFFRHATQCKTRVSRGCLHCKKIWHLLQLHARTCKESKCHVPRCNDLKEHLKRLQHQSESRRRAAVMEMMRQQVAEVAANAG